MSRRKGASIQGIPPRRTEGGNIYNTLSLAHRYPGATPEGSAAPEDEKGGSATRRGVSLLHDTTVQERESTAGKKNPSGEGRGHNNTCSRGDESSLFRNSCANP